MSDGGAPKSRGARENFPFPPLDGPIWTYERLNKWISWTLCKTTACHGQTVTDKQRSHAVEPTDEFHKKNIQHSTFDQPVHIFFSKFYISF